MSATPVPRWRRLLPLFAAWALLLSIETFGQIALKTAGGKVGAFELDRASLVLALHVPWLWLGLACYLGQFVVWMAILEKSALSAAFPTSAIAFVAVMIASRVVFGDPMGWEKMLGSVIIVTGILLLGGDEASSPPASTGKDIDWKSA